MEGKETSNFKTSKNELKIKIANKHTSSGRGGKKWKPKD